MCTCLKTASCSLRRGTKCNKRASKTEAKLMLFFFIRLRDGGSLSSRIVFSSFVLFFFWTHSMASILLFSIHTIVDTVPLSIRVLVARGKVVESRAFRRLIFSSRSHSAVKIEKTKRKKNEKNHSAGSSLVASSPAWARASRPRPSACCSRHAGTA